jgi:uncharacterized protein YkwD
MGSRFVIPVRARQVIVAALALTVLILVVGAPAPWPRSEAGAPCPGSDVVPTAVSMPAYGDTTLCLLNAQRSAGGVPALTRNPALDAAAVAYSQRMVAASFFSHVAPDGTHLVDRLNASRYIPRDRVWVVGENLAWGTGGLSTADDLMAQWMASPSHRANILRPDFRDVGVGVALGSPSDSATGVTVTTEFGATRPSAGQPAESSKAADRAAARRRMARRSCRPGQRRAVAGHGGTAKRRGARRCRARAARDSAGSRR